MIHTGSYDHNLPLLKPLPAGKYGVQCCRGPCFEACGFGDAAGGQDNGGLGCTLVPSKAELKQWAELFASTGPLGSWSPWRSQVVRWDTQSQLGARDCNRSAYQCDRRFYKAADDGLYDLAYIPEGEVVDPGEVDSDGFFELARRELTGGVPSRTCSSEQGSGRVSSCDRMSSANDSGCIISRVALEHRVFELVCIHYEGELSQALRKLHPKIGAEDLHAKVRGIVVSETLAWQQQRCAAMLTPFTARIVWSKDQM